MKLKVVVFVCLSFLSIILTGCGTSVEDGAGTAAKNYFQAIVDADEERIATISCPGWESSARGDVAAFVGVEAHLEEVECKPISESDTEAVVECSGAIVATYNNEDTNFELKDKQLKVVNQSGEWLVCGYAQ